MAVPKKRKRYDPSEIEINTPGFTHGRFSLNNPEYALRLAMVVSEFEHLEDYMAEVFGMLLNDKDSRAAGYLLRSMKAPRARYDAMKDMLEKAQWNAALGDEWDGILREYWKIGRQRNKYVHGRWYTEVSDAQSVLFAPVSEHGWTVMTAKPLSLKAMDDLITRIRKLTLRLFKTTAAKRLRDVGLPVPPHLATEPATGTTRPKAPRTTPPRRERKAQRKKLIEAALKK